ncbi:MAG: ornithine cyclodeaminase family protein [Planctomycetota bacterium]|nr:ornithine cyclodeaminase family protein [Planctomycetota bacterium]
MRPRVLSASDLWEALPMRAAIDACRAAFAALAAGEVTAPPRVQLVEGDRTTLLMGASGAVGRIAKVVNVFPANAARGLATTTGVVTVLDPDTGHTVGVCDGGVLTAIRTGAAAGLATDLLARRDARVGAVIGAGGQAHTQLLAMVSVRALQEVRVYARDRERLERFVSRLQEQVDADVVAATSVTAAVQGADVVSAATSASSPVFDGGALAAGAHVNGVGSYRLDMRELDQRAIERAGRVVVDLRASALEEAGELVAARDAGVTSPSDWIELGELVRDPSHGRASEDEVTLFKSVGHAAQDLYAARAAIDEAERRGLGQLLEL